MFKAFLFGLPFCIKIKRFFFFVNSVYLLTLVIANVTKRTVTIPVLIKVVLKLCIVLCGCY